MTTNTPRANSASRISATSRLAIDWTACEGAGSCVELLPELLEQDDWGYPLIRSGERTAAVPHHLDRHAQSAVRLCPRLALRYIDS
jgi:ferredoxin